MLAIENPKEHDKNPIKLAIDLEGKDVYYVKDQMLPAIRATKDPFDYLDERELYALKRRYRVGTKIFKQIRRCYKNKHEHIDLGDDPCIEHKLLISDIEDQIIGKMKKQYLGGRDLVPYFDVSMTGKIAMHVSVIASSGSGKSFLTAKILLANFKDSPIIIFSPTAHRDPAYLDVQRRLGKRRVKLIKSNTIDIPLDETMVPRGGVVVFDDAEATLQPARGFIAALQSRLLFHGRHLRNKEGSGVTVINVMHDAFRQRETKAASIESSRIILFPNSNRSVSTKYLKSRLNFTSKEIKKLYDFCGKSRWCCIYTHFPLAVVTPTGVMLR